MALEYRGMLTSQAFPFLFGWWTRWIDPVRFPDSIELIRQIFPTENIPADSLSMRRVLYRIRLVKKPIPLLWEEFRYGIIPFYARQIAREVATRMIHSS